MANAIQKSKTGHSQAIYAYTVPVSFPADGSETTTAHELPADGIVVDCYLIVDTAEATGTTKLLDVGLLADDADGFLDGVNCAALGFVGNSLADGAATRGAYLRNDEDGAGANAFAHYNLAASAERTVSITASAADWAEFVGRVVFLIARDPDKRY